VCVEGFEADGLDCVPTVPDGDADGDSDGDGDGDGDADADGDADTDADADGDADLDADGDEPGGPTIDGIDGTGPNVPVNPRPEDRSDWDAHAADRAAASHRVSTVDQDLVITGVALEETESVLAEGLSGQGTIEFTIEEASMNRVRVRFPAALTIAGGLFLLTLTTPDGVAEAQVFFLQGQDGADGEQGLQGEQGPPGADGADGDSVLTCAAGVCTLDQDLVVSGIITSDELTVETSVWLPECPQGYERDETETDFVLCTNGLDEMVKVGDFWVDRYESSVWVNDDCTGTQYGDTNDWAAVSATFPYHGQFTTPLHACSVSGVTPSRYLTWFQAQAACAASGKHLITNAEWQQAVEGTVDPGSSAGGGGGCVTSAAGPRVTGGGTSCVSYWGVEDMIGNLRELVADWYGQGSDTDDGAQPAEYFGDYYLNVNPAQYTARAEHFPAAGNRGGNFANGTSAGAFATNLADSPGNAIYDLGFRCARSR
jgi:hypothetical protein